MGWRAAPVRRRAPRGDRARRARGRRNAWSRDHRSPPARGRHTRLHRDRGAGGHAAGDAHHVGHHHSARSEWKDGSMARLNYSELNDTVRYTAWSVFRVEPGRLPDDRGAAARETTEYLDALEDKGVVVRGVYDVSGLR